MRHGERRQRILAVLDERDSVQIAELSKELGASRETVRKDLQALDEQGLLTQVRGGAVGKVTAPESAYHARRASQLSEKQAIASHAAALVEPGMTIFLDYGSTNYVLARSLLAQPELTVITNSFPIASLLADSAHITTILPGGKIRANEQSLYGAPTLRNLAMLNMDLGFFGCAGIHPRAGVTNPHMEETHVSAAAMRQCGTSILLADHTKFGVIAPHTVATATEFTEILTDSIADIDPSIVDALDHPHLTQAAGATS
ncbi:MAG: DeoR/GlpR family DNA-binding transcription regulator [Dermabacter sp.]|nr:DeoR/GlpR family DNA-binding transcription regulator [Dermabacter sp.]